MNNQMLDKPNIRLIDTERERLVEGIFGVSFRDDGGEWVPHYEKKNLIVNGARKIMAHAIGDCGASNCINQFRLGGDNNLTAAVMLDPVRPEPEDTNLVYYSNLFVRNRGDLLLGLPAFTVSYPDEPNETSVLFEVLIGKEEANVQDPTPTVYLAAGLYVGAGSMLFSSQTFPVITKTPNREFLFSWQIRF